MLEALFVCRSTAGAAPEVIGRALSNGPQGARHSETSDGKTNARGTVHPERHLARGRVGGFDLYERPAQLLHSRARRECGWVVDDGLSMWGSPVHPSR